MKTTAYLLIAAMAVSMAACNPDEDKQQNGNDSIPEWMAEEIYAGGRLGTTFNQSASAYEDPTPAVTDFSAFKKGEMFFEHTVTQNNPPFNGLGPVYVRSSCESCHPGYGHGRRMDRYRADDWANGYLLVVYDKTTNAYEKSVAGMPQTKAVAPFKAPIDEEMIDIQWLPYTDEWGNRFPDGETYDLIYPEVNIPEAAFYAPLDAPYGNLAFRLETTIGIYGTGMIDAIPDDSLKAQYQREHDMGFELNPAFWAGSDWAPTAFYGNTTHPKRYTYALTRGPLQDAPGSNAIWNITNVTRSNKRSHYLSLNPDIYARHSAKDPEVQAQFYTYFPEWNKSGDPETDIYNYLRCDTLPAEMSDQDYVDFMVWHRGLAVPAARDLDQPDVQRGRELFRQIGCAICHRPSWETGDDNFTDPTGFFRDGDSRLPRYPHQKIWPYTDLVQHRLFMKNDIRTGWCRTTPLWGRGLAPLCSGHSDRLHDCRARNVIEAIMWHGAAQSDARRSVENFRKLSKADRDAVVKFINAI
jgi:CxxC motif-containing protein (DUF1111 family)